MNVEEQLRRRSGQQVWLPNLKVWARIPAHSDAAGPSGRPAAEAAALHSSSPAEAGAPGMAAGGPARPKDSYTGFSLAQEQPDSDCELLEDGGGGSEDGLPVCPICLVEIFDLREKAVVISCMHVFCLDCLSRWSALKKSCPLCKRRIQGYMHGILSETNYKQHMLPDTPPRLPDKAPPLSPQRDSGRPIIDLSPPRRETSSSGRQQQPAQLGRASEARSSSRSSSCRRSSHNLEGEWVPGLWPPVRAPSRRPAQRGSAAHDAPRAAAGPRPYFFRVQAQAQSQVRGGALAGRAGLAQEGPDAAQQLQDAAEAFRRHIYVQGLYAQPLDEGALGSAPPSMSEERRQQRLQAWADRELRALLCSDDTAIVRAYVMGLVRATGSSRRQEDAVDALRPFLQEHAEHFWHELRCFAAVAVSMQTYDRLVRYSRERSSPASPAAEQEDRSSAETGRQERERCASGSGQRRARRRFSDETPPGESGHAKDGDGLAEDGRSSSRRRVVAREDGRSREDWSLHSDWHRKERTRRRQRSRSADERVARPRASSPSGDAGDAGRHAASASALAELRLRALAELQARQGRCM